MFTLLSHTFIQHTLIAGIIVGIVAPTIGFFLVLRRYALLADTIAHISLAGLALGLLLNVQPIFTAVATTVPASLLMERFRLRGRLASEWTLSLFLSGSLAIAIILFSFTRNAATQVTGLLFGNILTVTTLDLCIMGFFAVIVLGTLMFTWRAQLTTAFDEPFARVLGINTNLYTTLLMLLGAVTITLALPTIGVLLIGALMVIPVITALQFQISFGRTLFVAIGFALFSVLGGIFLAYFLNLAVSGTIVLLLITCFLTVYLSTSARS